jgi:dihydroorotate dehydrogenase
VPKEKKQSVRKIGAGTMVFTNVPAPLSFINCIEKIISQKITTPFFISITSRAQTKEERLAELGQMIAVLHERKSEMGVSFGLELDFSWPDDAFDQNELSDEIREAIVQASVLDIPLVVKISILMAPDIASDILTLEKCDAISLSNSIPWNAFPDDAKKIFFRSKTSPLARFGDGRISGKYLLHLTAEWVKQFRRGGSRKPILADGGILRARDVQEMQEAGVTAIILCSIYDLRPWNILNVIRQIKKNRQKK